MNPMTDRQREVYEFIVDHIAQRGCPPTLREIADHFEFAGVNSSAQYVEALERKKMIQRGHDSSSRQVRVTDPLAVMRRQFAHLTTKQRAEFVKFITEGQVDTDGAMMEAKHG